jgi:DNA repair exonuclease SbcCD ATPase subunit
MIDLSQKAICVAVTVPGMGTSKKDKDVTKEVLELKGAAVDSGNFVKKLLSGYAGEVKTAEMAIRNVVLEYTSPWGERLRILPIEKLQDFQKELRAAIENLQSKVETLIQLLPEAIEKDHVRLNGMFKPEDYPSAQQLRSKYSSENIKVDYFPIPALDWRINIADEVLADIQQSVEKQSTRHIEGVTRDLASRIKRLLVDPPVSGKGFIERLMDSEPKFRESMLERIVDTISLIQNLMPITNLPEVQDNLEKIREKLAKFSADSLNSNGIARKVIAKEIDEVTKKMEDYF